jgi:hypothetical protein
MRGTPLNPHPTVDDECRESRGLPYWLRDQLSGFAEHLRSSPPYNQDQLGRALDGIADGREWQAMVWR